jgi:hypothetical protein
MYIDRNLFGAFSSSTCSIGLFIERFGLVRYLSVSCAHDGPVVLVCHMPAKDGVWGRMHARTELNGPSVQRLYFNEGMYINWVSRDEIIGIMDVFFCTFERGVPL